MDPAIRVQDLGKRYRIGEFEPYATLRDTIARKLSIRRKKHKTARSASMSEQSTSASNYIWALKNVSLTVEQGEAVGLIGPNGAGKTTLLKVLSRITEPTEGWATIRGRVRSLLEVGTGFHMELTGRENVYLNGAILGMTRAEIDDKFEEIVDFAEIRDFIDTPVKRYSDGMRVRLGFAVAAHLQPEIILVDEVLAVGDAAFQRKCLGKMGDVVSEGRTVVLVSHNMAAIQNLCTVAYGLDHGRIFASGDVNAVIREYLESHDRSLPVPLASRTDRRGSGRLRLTSFSIAGAIKSPTTAQCGVPTSIEIGYEGEPSLRNVDIDMLFFNRFGECVLVVGTSFVGRDFDRLPGRGTFVCRFEKFPLLPGVYNVNLNCGINSIAADVIRNAATIQVVEGDYYSTGKIPSRGHVAVPYDWEVTGPSEPSQTEPPVPSR
jgi:lipopolysaccharide transport system ATP-binding protein